MNMFTCSHGLSFIRFLEKGHKKFIISHFAATAIY